MKLKTLLIIKHYHKTLIIYKYNHKEIYLIFILILTLQLLIARLIHKLDKSILISFKIIMTNCKL